MLSCMLEGTSPTVLTLPVYPEQAHGGQWGCLDFSIQQEWFCWLEKKNKQTTERFCTSIAVGSKVYPKSEHMEKVGNDLLLTPG